MTLAAGTRVGPYEILAAIGAGGMGEVYRARDSRLNREVAIKVLPDAFASDAERLARFEREAQLLASLNHPNIAHVHGLEEGNGTRAIVMELVPGDDLAQRLARGPLPLSEALPIAKQVAEALEAAHDVGIVHRDLKPANVKVRDDGTVKVLDFGLAKALDPGLPLTSNVANSPTLSVHATHVGVILGTAAYMAPEQAHGRAADRRADIFAFGVVFFEMLTGKQAFSGESVSDTLASVLKIDPDWSQLPSDIPAHIHTLLRRCLTKDRAQRLQAIGEARIVLAQPTLTEPPQTLNRKPSLLTWGLAAAVALVSVVAAWGWFRVTPPAKRTILRFADATAVASVPGAIALARDGTRLAFVSGPRRQIHVRSLDQFEAIPIPKTEDARLLCFSPDGRSISYVAGEIQSARNQLMAVGVDGGLPRKLADVSGRVAPVTQRWSDNAAIFFIADGALMRIPSSGGPVETLAEPDAKENERSFSSPQLLPDGNHVLLSIGTGLTPRSNRIVAFNLESRQKKVLLERVGTAQYVPSEPGSSSGYLVFYDANTGSLDALAFDAQRLEIMGSLVPVVDGVRGVPGPSGAFSISESGTLAYVPGAAPGSPDRTLVWVDRDGKEQPTGAPTRQYNLPRLARAGDRVAVEIQNQTPVSIWVYDFARNILSPVVPGGGRGISPVWTPDDRRLVYAAGGGPESPTSLAVAPADRSSPPTMLDEATSSMLPTSVSPDGEFVLGVSRARDAAGGSGSSVIIVPLSRGSSKLRQLLTSPFRKSDVVFSPLDGRWIAYASDESGRPEVYVTAYPGPGAEIPVSNEGGTTPRWRRDGQELFYRDGGKMMAVKIEQAPALRVASQPAMLFEGTYSTGYDVAPDGQRFLMIKNTAVASAGPATHVNVVVNWVEELKARVVTR